MAGFNAEATGAKVYKDYTTDGKIDDPKEPAKQNDNATAASRRLISEAMQGSNNDRGIAAQNIEAGLNAQAGDNSNKLMTSGILPNIALAYAQDDGKIKGQATGGRDNFANLSKLDGKGDGLSLNDLVTAAKNEGGKVDAVDSLMAKAILTNENFRKAYFENKSENGAEKLKVGDQEIALDGNYTQAEMRTILQNEKAKLGAAAAQNPQLETKEGATLNPEQVKALNERKVPLDKISGGTITGNGSTWEAFEAGNTNAPRDGLIARNEFDNLKDKLGLKDVPFEKLATTVSGESYIRYDKESGRLIGPLADAKTDALSEPFNSTYKNGWSYIETQLGNGTDGQITTQEFEQAQKRIAAMASAENAPAEVKKIYARLKDIKADQLPRLKSSDGQEYITYDTNSGRLLSTLGDAPPQQTAIS